MESKKKSWFNANAGLRMGNTNLLSHLRRVELSKVDALSPTRYIIMTSVALTPNRKDNIVRALQPWIKDPSDVYGKDDISGLLVSHPEVERRHIKLWLTSTEVLDALLNSDIANRSEAAVEDAKHQLRLGFQTRVMTDPVRFSTRPTCA